MSVDNICADFRKIGTFPFNPEAILKDCTESTSLADESEMEPASGSSSSSQSHFSQLEERYENNYDIYTDPDYVAWLQKFHPKSLPSLETMLDVNSDCVFDDLMSVGSSLSVLNPLHRFLVPLQAAPLLPLIVPL